MYEKGPSIRRIGPVASLVNKILKHRHWDVLSNIFVYNLWGFLYWGYQTSGMEHHINKDLGIRVTPRYKVDKK